MSYPFHQKRVFLAFSLVMSVSQVMLGCSSGEKAKNFAKESAARYWQDKAYPGKAFDVNVVEAEKIEDGKFRVKGLVDGETRVGVFNPETETFSEGYYSLAHERNKKIAELEQEVKYYRERSEALEKENYKLKVKLGVEDSEEPQRGSSKKKPKKNTSSRKASVPVQESTDDDEDDGVGVEDSSSDASDSKTTKKSNASSDSVENEKKRP